MKRKYATHLHTEYSDGRRRLSVLVDLIKQSPDFEGLMPAEHDTQAGITPLQILAKNAGVVGIGGVEFGVSFTIDSHPIVFEIIGYNVDPHDRDIIDICRQNQEWRAHRIDDMVDRLNEHLQAQGSSKIKIGDVKASVPSGVPVGRPHLARFMADHKYVEWPKQAFDLYLDPLAPYCVFGDRKAVGIEDVLDAITKAGGIAVVPHPANVALQHQQHGVTDHKFSQFLLRYVKKGQIHGIEVGYPYHIRGKLGCDTFTHASELVKAWDGLARSLAKESPVVRLYACDYHGTPTDVSLTDPSYGTDALQIKQLFYAAYGNNKEFSRIRKGIR